jgi:hypothetical protein
LLLRPRSRYVLAWLFALAATAAFAYVAWHCFDRADRGDANLGHVYIDFGGQWLMGRMLVEGYGRDLYDLSFQHDVIHAHYPVEDQDPEQETDDADDLFGALMGSNAFTESRKAAAEAVAAFLAPLAATDAQDATSLLTAGLEHWDTEPLQDLAVKYIGGPLYPPVQALYFYPQALLEPQAAYRVAQALNLVMAWLCGLAVSRLSRGRVWWPLATVLVMGLPSFAGSCNLGQNATLSLAILFWGWVLVAAGREGWGGAVWGLLAYKPVWAMSFFFVLALTGRWRACLTMLAVGTALALATLPLVGIESWFDWLQVGKIAVHVYDVDENWIFLSRDLLSIPRRWLLDFQMPYEERDTSWLARVLGWGLLATVAILAAGLALWRRRQARVPTGPPAAFLLLSGWLVCFHFMYYDALLAALPMFLLTAAPPRDYLRVLLLPVSPTHGGGFSFRVSNRGIGLLLIIVLIGIHAAHGALSQGDMHAPPWDTFYLLAVWLGCGWVWLRTPDPGKVKEEIKDEEKRYQLSPSPR